MQKSRYWAFILYPDSAPDFWLELLESYHLPMAISPLHDMDLNSDGEYKKAHYHVLIAYGNSTTQSNIDRISKMVNGSMAIPVMSLKGYFRYLTHKDNPEKYQYDEKQIKMLSGFDPSDYWSYTAEEEMKMKIEIRQQIKDNKIYEYWDLIEFLEGYDLALCRYASAHTIYFNTLLTSRRHKNKISLK